MQQERGPTQERAQPEEKGPHRGHGCGMGAEAGLSGEGPGRRGEGRCRGPEGKRASQWSRGPWRGEGPA